MLPFVAWGVIADFLKNVAITAPRAGRVAGRILGAGPRYHRVCLPVRIADPAVGRARGRVGADAPRVPRADARGARRRVNAASGTRRARPARQGNRVQHLIVVVVVAVAYGVLGGVAAAIAYAPTDAWTVWLASGMVFGALLAVRRVRWGAVLAGGFVGAAAFALWIGTSVVDALGYGVHRGARVGRRRAARVAPGDASAEARQRARPRGAHRRRARCRSRSSARCSPPAGTSRPAAARRTRRSASGCCRTSSARCSSRRSSSRGRSCASGARAA